MHAVATEADPVAELRAELTARGITFEEDGADRNVRGRTGALTPELRTAIQLHKSTLVVTRTGFTPLDRAIIRSTAAKRTLAEVQRCRSGWAGRRPGQRPRTPRRVTLSSSGTGRPFERRSWPGGQRPDAASRPNRVLAPTPMRTPPPSPAIPVAAVTGRSI
jgi:hypothetical protein